MKIEMNERELSLVAEALREIGDRIGSDAWHDPRVGSFPPGSREVAEHLLWRISTAARDAVLRSDVEIAGWIERPSLCDDDFEFPEFPDIENDARTLADAVPELEAWIVETLDEGTGGVILDASGRAYEVRPACVVEVRLADPADIKKALRRPHRLSEVEFWNLRRAFDLLPARTATARDDSLKPQG